MKKLKNFAKKIVKVCKSVNVNPILYGSLLYSHYAKDKKVKINDIDFYVPEDSLEKIIKILKEKKIKHKYFPKWYTLQMFEGKSKVELDSLEYWYKGKKDFKNFDFNGLKIKSLSLKSLTKVYERASNSSDKPEKNREKYGVLKNLR